MLLTIILSSITIICLFLTFVFNKQVSIFFSKYWRTSLVAIFILVYSVIVMWMPNINEFINQKNSINQPWLRSNAYSGAFLLQLPTLMCIVMPISLLIDKSKTITKSMAPFMIVYCFMNLFIRFIGFNSIIIDQNSTTWYEYVFLGEESERMFFLSNFFILFLSSFVYISSKTFSKYSFFGGILIIGLVLLYYLTIKSVFGINACISGLAYGDWEQIGSYQAMFKPIANIFGNVQDIGFAWMFNIWFAIYLVMTFVLVLLKNFLTINPIKISLVNEPWYRKSTFLKSFLSPFDAALNNLISSIIPYGYFYPKKILKLKLKNFRYYYNNFIALSTIDKYEKCIEDLEYNFSNQIRNKNTLLRKQKHKIDKAEDIKKLQAMKLEELEREIDEELKQINHKKILKRNKELQRKLSKEAKKNHIVIENNDEVTNV